MDKINFKWKRVQYDIDNEPTMTCQVFINDRSLIDIVKQVELPMARVNDEEAIAGGYAPLTIEDLYESINISDGDDKAKEGVLLGCSCGSVECWPLYVKIEQSENLVIWHGFRNPHRNWGYGKLGPFVFDKKQYKYALDHLEKMKDLVDEKKDMFGFELDMLRSGYIEIKFYKGEMTRTLCCDECMGDPLPEMVRMYQKLKVNEPYEFETFKEPCCRGCELSMKTAFIGGENVLFTVSFEKEDDEEYSGKFEEVISKQYCLDLFDELFNNIHDNIEYPYQFPCFKFLDKEQHNLVYADAADVFSVERDEYFFEEYDERKRKQVRETVEISPRGKIFEKAYTKMLLDKVIPAEW